MRPSQSWPAVLCAGALCVVAAATTAVAQEKKKEQQAEQPLSVKLGAVVLDSQDRLVNDLRQEDFQILEDGVAQKISVFERQDGRHACGLVVGSSRSLRSEINNVIEFAQMIVAGT